jgi:ribosome-associated translation inhibitor RaiA
MTRSMAPPQPQVHLHGSIRAGQVEYARRKVAAALAHAPRPVLFVRLNLTRAAAPGLTRPYSVTIHIDLSGVDLHATAAAATFTEAVDLARRRLNTRLGRVTRRR